MLVVWLYIVKRYLIEVDKMKIRLSLIVLFLLLVCEVYAIPAGEQYSLAEIPECYGNVIVKARYKNVENNQYSLVGCNMMNDMDGWEGWFCPCQDFRNLYLMTGNNTKGEYDFVVEYYVEPVDLDNINDSNINNIDMATHEAIRTLNINNIIVEPIIVKETFSMPIVNGVMTIIGIIGAVIIILVFLLIGLWRWISGDKDNKIKTRKDMKPIVEEKEKDKIIIDEDDFLRNCSK